MSDAPIEVARRANDWWTAIPFEKLREVFLSAGDLEEATAMLGKVGVDPPPPIDPDVEINVGGFPGGEILAGGHGLDGWLRFWREWVEPWEDLSFEAANYDQIGDHVLVDASVRARGRASGAPVELAVVQQWTITDGRIAAYGVFADREGALAMLERMDAERR